MLGWLGSAGWLTIIIRVSRVSAVVSVRVSVVNFST